MEAEPRTTDDAGSSAENGATPSRALVRLAALASVGAGAVHATAAGAHSEHRQAAWAFAALAAAQIGWGVRALVRPLPSSATVGAGISMVALLGWLAAATVGLPLSGLEGPQAFQWADGVAAALAAVALVAALSSLTDATTRRVPTSRTAAAGATAALAVAALAGMALATDHSHGGGAAHGHHEVATGATDDHPHAGADHHPVAGDHGHAHADAVEPDSTAEETTGTADEDVDAGDDHGDHQNDGHHGDHGSSAVPAAPYDPDLPIDLSGIEGVTLEQQARAENLVAVTLLRLPQFADPTDAESRGYHSIGDGLTGYEHYVNWSLINDDVVLDPDQPESLVYQVVDGEKTLVAAMFMLPDGVGLDEVPDLGGRLTQWHVHDDLCYTSDPVAPRVAGLRRPGGPCAEGLVPGRENAMIHVWIVPHECGPFAALEGVGGGTVPEGEDRWCDHAHGA